MRDNRGFTVIELLLASAVTMIISLVMIGLISNILTAWSRLSGNLSTGSQARLVLDVMAEDLQNSFYQDDGKVWLAASILHRTGPNGTGNSGVWSNDRENHPKPVDGSSLQLLPRPGEPFDVERTPWRYGTAGTWLRFFSAAPGGSDGQLPKAIAYQIVRRRVTSAPDAEVRYMLYRSEVSGEKTLEAGYDIRQSTPQPLAYEPDPNPTDPDDDPKSTQGHPNTIRKPNGISVIASDVIDFGVRLYARDADGNLELVFPASDSEDEIHEARLDGDPFPDVMDVFIRVLTPEGVQLIRNHEAQPAGRTPPQSWWEIAEANSRVYVRRVQLNASR